MKKIRVVLIEDHDLTRFCTKISLQRSGKIEVIGEAANGCDGLALIKTAHPDVAIVDIDLPGMQGTEIAREFKASPEALASKTKVLMLTLHNTEEMIQTAIAAGADSYCVKTSSPSDLLEAILSTYEGATWIDPEVRETTMQNLLLKTS